MIKLPQVPGGDMAGVVVEADEGKAPAKATPRCLRHTAGCLVPCSLQPLCLRDMYMDVYGAGSAFRPGSQVMALTDGFQPNTRHGTFAELVSVPVDQLAAMPPGLSFEEGASLPLVSLTAHQVGRDVRGPSPCSTGGNARMDAANSAASPGRMHPRLVFLRPAGAGGRRGAEGPAPAGARRRRRRGQRSNPAGQGQGHARHHHLLRGQRRLCEAGGCTVGAGPGEGAGAQEASTAVPAAAAPTGRSTCPGTPPCLRCCLPPPAAGRRRGGRLPGAAVRGGAQRAAV